MKRIGLKFKILFVSIIITFISLVIISLLTLNVAKTKITEAIMEQLIHG